MMSPYKIQKAHTSLQKTSKHSNGFALPLVVVVGFILTVGGFALLARSFGGLVNSIRAEQSRQAREIAEAGMAETLESLNPKIQLSSHQLLSKC